MFCALFFHWSCCWSSSLGSLGQECLFTLPGLSNQQVTQACWLLSSFFLELCLCGQCLHLPKLVLHMSWGFLRRSVAANYGLLLVIYPYFFLAPCKWFDRIFTERHFIQFLANKMKEFLNFNLHCILIFDAKQIYWKLQVTNLRNKEVTANPTPQSWPKPWKNWYFENPKP